MKRVSGVIILQLLAICLFGQTIKIEKKNKPNFIFVLVDDMGYGDLKLFSPFGVPTPNLEQLASEGIKFTRFYVNSPICSPSRTAFLTGQYPLRWNITSYLADSAYNVKRGMDQYLNIKAPSIGRVMQENGYYTAHIGKWHMGGQRNVKGAPLITDFGFDQSLTSFEGLGDRIGWVFETQKWEGSDKFPLSVQQEKLGFGKVTWVKRYKESEIYVDRVIEEIKAAQKVGKPFYINLWHSDVHLPVEAPPGLRGDGSLANQYVGTIKALDVQLGKLFNFVRNNPALKNNTVIIFTSDNGPPKAAGSSGGLRGGKGQLYEGGISEPFIVWAPAIMKSDAVGKTNSTTLIAGMDIFPTVLSLAGINKPLHTKPDGVDMKEALLGKNMIRKSPVMWVRPPDTKGQGHQFQDLSIIEGKWKLLTNIDGSHTELFDLENDRSEKNDVASQNPDVEKRLKSGVLKWFFSIRTGAENASRPWM